MIVLNKYFFNSNEKFSKKTNAEKNQFFFLGVELQMLCLLLAVEHTKKYIPLFYRVIASPLFFVCCKQYIKELAGCRLKTNCPLVGPGNIGCVPSAGGLSN